MHYCNIIPSLQWRQISLANSSQYIHYRVECSFKSQCISDAAFKPLSGCWVHVFQEIFFSEWLHTSFIVAAWEYRSRLLFSSLEHFLLQEKTHWSIFKMLIYWAIINILLVVNKSLYLIIKFVSIFTLLLWQVLISIPYSRLNSARTWLLWF